MKLARDLALAIEQRWKLSLIILLFAAATVRFIAISHGIGIHPDERHMVMVTDGLSFQNLNPKSFAYGSFPYYAVFFSSELLGTIWAWLKTYDGIFYVGRGLCAFFGVWTVYLTFQLAHELLRSRIYALCAAWLLAFNFFHMQLSRFFTSDVILTAFCTAALLSMVRLSRGGTLWHFLWAGIWIGLAVASKIAGLYLFPSLAAAGVLYVVKTRPHPFSRTAAGLAAAALAAACVFFIASPYAIADFETFYQHTTEQLRMVRGEWRPPYAVQYVGTAPLFYSLWQMVWWTIGGVPFLFAVVGLLSLIPLICRPSQSLFGPPLLFAAFFLASSLGFQVKFPRYLLPLYPLIALLAASGLSYCTNWFREKFSERVICKESDVDSRDEARSQGQWWHARADAFMPILVGRIGLRGVLLALILLAGLLIRVIALDQIPFGLHGDEAWTGLDARRVLVEGWIGMYVWSALGQPGGPLYWTAAFFALFGESIYNLRFSMAIVGWMSLILIYLVGSQLFDTRVGLLACSFLAFDLWHIHYSRLGFMVITWPFVQLALLALVLGFVRCGRPALGVSLGILWAVGFYSYNAYPLTAFGLAFVVIAVVAFRKFFHVQASWSSLMWPLGGAMLGLVPLVVTLASEPQIVFARHGQLAVWHEAASGDLAGISRAIFTSALDWITHLIFIPMPDGSDAAGIIPMVWFPYAAAAILGIAGLIIDRRALPLVVLGTLFIVIPLGSILTVSSHGTFRRSLALTPVIALLAAHGVFTFLKGRSVAIQFALCIACALALGVRSLSFYFFEFPSHAMTRFVFCKELVAAADYLRELPGNKSVLFYSARWSINYETLRFLLPHVRGTDGSDEFRSESNAQKIPQHPTDYVIVLLDKYLEPGSKAALPFLEDSRLLYEGRDDEGGLLFEVREFAPS